MSTSKSSLQFLENIVQLRSQATTPSYIDYRGVQGHQGQTAPDAQKQLRCQGTRGKGDHQFWSKVVSRGDSQRGKITPETRRHGRQCTGRETRAGSNINSEMGNSVWGGEEVVGTKWSLTMEEHTRMIREESGHEEEGTIAEQGGNSPEVSNMERKLVHWTQRLQFQLKTGLWSATYSIQLGICGMSDDRKCKFCENPANLEHIISSCSVVFTDGRYTSGHDKVLFVLVFTSKRRRKKPRKGQRRHEIRQLRRSKEAEYKRRKGRNWTIGNCVAIRSK